MSLGATTDPRALAQRLREELGGADAVHDLVSEAVHRRASAVAGQVVEHRRADHDRRDRAIDRLLTSRATGIPVMLLLLFGVFYLTIEGANVPSQMLATALFWVEARLAALFSLAGSPAWLTGFVVHGVFRGLAWVVAVMLPPMAIFFPLFTLLEDAGYLPRVAFNLDGLFRRVGAHGKQSLTMAMGFGCNAAGVIATRIIDSPRERLIAILTNNFVPCNGRWPTLIMVSSLFVAAAVPSAWASLTAVSAVVAMCLVGVGATLAASWLLSGTLLRGEASGFQLELPPYRRPRVLQVIYTSLIDRTVFVLGRAVVVAAPAGGIIWILGNVPVGDSSLYSVAAASLDPLARSMGLDGVILLAFLAAIPANEIVVPTMLMGYLAAGQMLELDDMARLHSLLTSQGWTLTTALCLMLFSVLHYPCSTTTWTIWKETRSVRWTLAANLLPLGLAVVVCLVAAQILG